MLPVAAEPATAARLRQVPVVRPEAPEPELPVAVRPEPEALLLLQAVLSVAEATLLVSVVLPEVRLVAERVRRLALP